MESQVESSPESAQVLGALGLAPMQSGWTLQVTLSTVDHEHWFYRRNRLRAADLRLSLAVPAWSHWRAELERHDGEFLVQWRSADDLRVDAQALRWRKLTPWPRLASPLGFPGFASDLARVLGVQFLRHANLGARWTNLEQPGFDDRALRAWLEPCADTWDRTMRSGA